MEKEKKYVSPVPSIGFCLWYPEKQGYDPVPAIITSIGSTSINVTIWADANKGGIPKDGVRHISDPAFDKMAEHSGGVWDFTAEAKLLAKLEAQVAELMSAFVEQPVA